jgi:hypothetical protein
VGAGIERLDILLANDTVFDIAREGEVADLSLLAVVEAIRSPGHRAADSAGASCIGMVRAISDASGRCVVAHEVGSRVSNLRRPEALVGMTRWYSSLPFLDAVHDGNRRCGRKPPTCQTTVDSQAIQI